MLRLSKLNIAPFEAVLISSPANITYLTNFSNFTLEEREGYLFITKNAQYVITDSRYSEAVLDQVPHFKLEEINLKNSFTQIIERLVKNHKVNLLGIEEGNLTVAEFNRVKPFFKSISNIDISHLRVIKTSWEIEKIEKACRIGDKAFKKVITKIKPGVTEIELASDLKVFFNKNGADISFEPIVAFGPHSSIPHHQTGITKLGKESQFVLFDLGAKLDNYCSDMTRTIIYGKATTKQKKIYQTVLEAQQKAAEYIDITQKTGKEVTAIESDKIAREHIEKAGFIPYSHGLGHGTGLEVHEAPRLSIRSNEVLQPGMVFSIEPGIYIPGFGGVRIEDLFVLEDSGLRQLTKSSKDIIEI